MSGCGARLSYDEFHTMCRSIKVLRHPAVPATDEEITAAALQFVRKISGYRHPSKANQSAFDAAVRDIAAASKRLLRNLAVTTSASARAGL